MTEPEARAELEIMVAMAEEPALTSADIDKLIKKAKRADSEGRAPSDPAWVPTWDLNYAAAMGWRWKAGRVATRYTYSADGMTLNRKEMREACKEMARMYSRGGRTSTVSGATARSSAEGSSAGSS